MNERKKLIVSEFADYDRFAANCLHLCIVGAAIAIAAAAIVWAAPATAWLERAL